MTIFLTMIAWIIFMRLVCQADMKTYKLYTGATAYKVSMGAAMLAMSYIIFWIGIRSGMADTPAYIYGFQTAPADLSQIPGILLSDVKGQAWQALVVLFKTLVSSNYHAWLMFLAVVMGSCVAICHQKYSEAFFFSIIIFILNGNATWMCNGMRQFLCVTLLMLAFPWLLKGKMKWYLGFICLLSLFHFTVLLMLPIYFIVRQRPWSKIVMLSMAGIILACLFAEPLAGEVEGALSSTSYKDSTVMLEEDDGVHPLRVCVAAAPVFLAWLHRKRIAKENNRLLNVCINMSLLTAALYLFGVFTSGTLMGRLPVYCEVYATIALPALINRFKSKGIRSALFSGCFLCYFAFFHLILGRFYYVSELTGLIR